MQKIEMKGKEVNPAVNRVTIRELFSKAKDKGETLLLLEQAIKEETAAYRREHHSAISSGRAVNFPRGSIQIDKGCDDLQRALLDCGKLLSEDTNLSNFNAYCSVVSYLIDNRNDPKNYGLLSLRDLISSKAFYAGQLQDFAKMVEHQGNTYENITFRLEAVVVHLNAW